MIFLPRCHWLLRATLVVVLVLVQPNNTGAVPAPDPTFDENREEIPLPNEEGWQATDSEKAAYRLLARNHFVEAREMSERILANDSRSIVGRLVFGAALHYGEKDLPRSIHELETARALYDQQYAGIPKEQQPAWRWHLVLLRSLVWTYEELDRPTDTIRTIDEYDGQFQPALLNERIWSLIKQHRFDDAKRWIAAPQGLPNKRWPYDQIFLACQMAFEMGERQGLYDACLRPLTERGEESPSVVAHANAAEAAEAVFRFADTERILIAATKLDVEPDGAVNPFQVLSELYVAQGRMAEALDAAAQARDYRPRIAPWLDQQSATELQSTEVEIALLTGDFDRAVESAWQSVEQTDRTGTWTAKVEQRKAATLLRLAVVLRARAAWQEEASHAAPLWRSCKLRFLALRDRFLGWVQGRRLRKLLLEGDFLNRTFHPYAQGNVDVSEWLVPEVTDVVGGALVLSAVGAAAREDNYTGTEGYYDTFLAEAYFACGDMAAAERHANRALAGLPVSEKLLHARVSLITARILHKRSGAAAAAGYYLQALQHDPSLFRRFDVALPVRIATTESALGKKAARLLQSSPRLQISSENPFQLAIEGPDDRLQACLYGPQQEEIACAVAVAPAGMVQVERARLLYRSFHDRLFAFQIDRSQAGINSLDGETMPTPPRPAK